MMPTGAANGSGSQAAFNRPWGLAVDKNGNVFVADTENHTIRKMTPAGVVSTVAGTGSPGYSDGPGASASFNYPWDVAVDDAGNLFVADAANNRLRKITPTGAVTTIAGSGPVNWENAGYADGPALQAKLLAPAGLDLDEQGNLYFAEMGNHVVRKLSPAGLVTTMAGGFDAVDDEGYPRGGFFNATGAAARFQAPIDVAVDAQGNLFVADYDNCCVRKVTPTGVVTTHAGSGAYGYADGPGPTAQFSFLGGITIDACGTLYVPDEKFERIRRIAPDGQVSTVAGTGVYGFDNGPADVAQFASPEGVAIDKNGALYVTEYWGNRVRKIALPAPACGIAITGEAGSNTFSPNADGQKDTYKLTITAGSNWSLEVDGHPGAIDTGPGPNSGNKTFNWNGQVNRILLPDGKYTLRIRAGEQEKTTEVIIDTQEPTISGVTIGADSSRPGDNNYLIRATIADQGLAGLAEEDKPEVTVEGGVASNVNLNYEPSSGLLTYQAAIVPSASGGGRAYKLSQASNEGEIRVTISQRDRAANVAQVAQVLPRPIVLNVRLEPDTVLPLRDRQTDPASQASRSTVIVEATRGGQPVPNATVQLTATVIPHSGGHQHDHATRPTGRFLRNQSAQISVQTDANGQATVDYRSTGFGGVELVTARAGVSQGQGRLSVTYPLRSLSYTGTGISTFILEGSIANHPDNHYCTERTENRINAIAQMYVNRGYGRMYINDQSLENGGPFDLGPAYVSRYCPNPMFWGFCSHINHRQGDSTDTRAITTTAGVRPRWVRDRSGQMVLRVVPVPDEGLKNRIRFLGAAVLDEGNHWHITTH